MNKTLLMMLFYVSHIFYELGVCESAKVKAIYMQICLYSAGTAVAVAYQT